MWKCYGTASWTLSRTRDAEVQAINSTIVLVHKPAASTRRDPNKCMGNPEVD